MSGFNYQGVANTVAQNRADAQTAAAVQNAFSTIMDAWRKHTDDQIADKIMAMQSAPKAIPVTSDGKPLAADGSNAVVDDTGASTYADEAAYNKGITDPSHLNGYGYDMTPSVPSNGGVAGLKARLLAGKYADETALQMYRAAQTNVAVAKVDPNSAYGRHLGALTGHLDAETDALINPAPRPGGSGNPRMPVTQVDNPTHLNNYVQNLYGVDYSELQDAGPEDTHQVQGGVEYLLGGEPDKYGRPTEKRRVFIPQTDNDTIMGRARDIQNNIPRTLNQQAIDAARGQRSGRTSYTRPFGDLLAPGVRTSQVELPGDPAGTPPAGTLFNGQPAPASSPAPAASPAPATTTTAPGAPSAIPSEAEVAAWATANPNDQRIQSLLNWAAANPTDTRAGAILRGFAAAHDQHQSQ